MYATERDVRNVLLVIFSSDRGLCGAFNSNIFRSTRQFISNEYETYERNNRLFVMPVGQKAYDYYNKRGYQTINDFHELFGEQTFENVQRAASFAMKEFEQGRYDKVLLVYNRFKNVAQQAVTVEQMLPIQALSEEQQEADPKRKRLSIIFMSQTKNL